MTMPDWALANLRKGLVVPAHPLALTKERKLDGAGGLAVGVHTTQFAIRDPAYSLFKPVLQLAAETATGCDAATGRQTVLIAGICGETRQAVREAQFARVAGYHAGLLSLTALRTATETELMQHCQAVAQDIALFGFYLQPAVGGRVLPLSFWRKFADIPNVVAIKIAPFNRYQTLDVVRAVAETGRVGEVALYTGNDDHIVLDLLTEYEWPTAEGTQRVSIVGGLLGQWACGTRRAVGILEACHQARQAGVIPSSLLSLANQLTDFNSAIFDAAHGFACCIPGIHEFLRRQGLMENIASLDPQEVLSPGQVEEIERVYRAYPHLHDEEFVTNNIAQWL